MVWYPGSMFWPFSWGTSEYLYSRSFILNQFYQRCVLCEHSENKKKKGGGGESLTSFLMMPSIPGSLRLSGWVFPELVTASYDRTGDLIC